MKSRMLLIVPVAACLAVPAVCLGAAQPKKGASSAKVRAPGIVKMWEDRGELTPAKVFWGEASELPDPASRLPAAPFSNFQKDDKPNAYSIKCDVTDKNGVTWTAKFGEEVHPDIVASRLAWALGYGADENYFVPGGRIEGVTGSTDRGKAAKYVKPDGSFPGSRFKRHPERHLQDASGNLVFWDESVNPGVPSEQLSGLKILDVMVFNWDAQPKNCEIVRKKGPNGPEDWYIMSDWGESFGNRKSAWKLADYQKEPFITGVSNGYVNFYFQDAIAKQAKDHQRIPLQDAQWFRKQLDKLTDDEIRAAFNAGVATDEMNQAYLTGDLARVNQLTTPEVNGFVAEFRRRIDEFKAKVPAGP